MGWRPSPRSAVSAARGPLPPRVSARNPPQKRPCVRSGGPRAGPWVSGSSRYPRVRARRLGASCRVLVRGAQRCAGGRALPHGFLGQKSGGGWLGGPRQRVEEQGTWAAQKHSEAGYGRPVDRGVWTAKTVKRPRQQPAHPQYANYWAPLTRKRHTMPHSAQPQHTNYWAPRTRKQHQQEHRPQRPTESSDPTQHAKGRTGDCPGPRKGATTRRNVTQGDTRSETVRVGARER